MSSIVSKLSCPKRGSAATVSWTLSTTLWHCISEIWPTKKLKKKKKKSQRQTPIAFTVRVQFPIWSESITS